MALNGMHLLQFSAAGSSVIDPGTGRAEPVEDERDYCAASAAVAWTGQALLAWGGQDCRATTGAKAVAGGLQLTPDLRGT